eukprot:5972419-Pleurochrysis_carterae.AAC.1
MVAELASLMQTLALGRSYDANRMVALITALQPEGAQPGATTTSTATSSISTCPAAAAAAAAAVAAPSSCTSTASPAAAPVLAAATVSTTAASSALGIGTGTSGPPLQHATAVRPPWFPEPERVPPPPPTLTGRVPQPSPSLTDAIKRVILAMREEEEANAHRLDTVSEEEEIEAALEWHRMQQESNVVRYSLQPLQDQPGPSDPRPMASAAPARVAQRPQAAAAAPMTAVHSDL